MKTFNFRRYKSLACLAWFALAGNSTIAQDQVVEEIIVTAQKRQVSIEDATVAIDFFNSETLADAGIDDFDDLTQVSASFSVNTAGGSAHTYIRGIGSGVNGTGVYGSVATYIDGVYYPRGYGLGAGASDFDNIDSVQVLKGPQGTIYGRNATGGAILIETKTPQPGDEFSGFGKAEIGDYGVRIFSGGVSGGVSDTLAGSVHFSINNSDGFIDNLAGGRGFDDTDGFSVGGKLVLQPTENFEAVLRGAHRQETANTLPTRQVGQFDTAEANAIFGAAAGLNNPQALYAATVLQLGGAFGVDVTNPAIVGGIIAAASGIRFPSGGKGTFSNNIPDQLQGILPGSGDIDDTQNGGYYEDTDISIRLKYSFDNFEVVGLGSYNEHFNNTSTDVFQADPSTMPDLSAVHPVLGLINSMNVGFSATFPSEAYAGEVYAISTNSDIEWIAGLYYFTESGRSRIAAGAFEFDALITDNDWEVESVSAYGEVNYPITDALILTAGGRYTDESYDLVDSFPVGNVGSLSRSDSEFTYTAKLSYDTGNWLYYGGYSTGFKSASLNPSNPAAGSVAPETIGSFEFGIKGKVMDGRARVSASGFYYDYENLQLNILNPVNSATFLVDGVTAEVYGLELGVDADITETTSLVVDTTILDHEFTSDGVIPATAATPQIVTPIDGNSLPMTSDLVFTAGLAQTVALGNGEINFNANVRYNSGFWADQANRFGSGGDEDDEFVTVNASLKFIDGNERYEASFYVNNLFDKEYYSGGIAAAGGLSQFARVGRPRHFGGTVQINF